MGPCLMAHSFNLSTQEFEVSLVYVGNPRLTSVSYSELVGFFFKYHITF